MMIPSVVSLQWVQGRSASARRVQRHEGHHRLSDLTV